MHPRSQIGLLSVSFVKKPLMRWARVGGLALAAVQLVLNF
jgi:hypothetical protein